GAHPYIVVAVIEHHGFGETIESKFRSVISCASRKSVLPRQAAYVHYITAPTLLEPWQSCMGTVKNTREIGVEHSPPIFDGQCRSACEFADARIVNQDVEATEFAIHEFEKP